MHTTALKTVSALTSCAAVLSVGMVFASNSAAQTADASPIYGVTLPAGYRDWQMVAVSHVPDAGPNRLKAILGNPAAIKALKDGTLPLPDGAILAKVEWHAEQHPELSDRVLGEPNAFIPGARLELGVMVKDSKKYASTGGWGYGEFVDGKPLDKATHETCNGCHVAGAGPKNDFVFTHYAK
jgi:hypothetical protein